MTGAVRFRSEWAELFVAQNRPLINVRLPAIWVGSPQMGQLPDREQKAAHHGVADQLFAHL